VVESCKIVFIGGTSIHYSDTFAQHHRQTDDSITPVRSAKHYNTNYNKWHTTHGWEIS